MELNDFKKRYAQLTDKRPTQQTIADVTGYKIDAVKSWTRLSTETRSPVPTPAKVAMSLYIEKLESGRTATLAVLDAARSGSNPFYTPLTWDNGEAFFTHLKESSYDGRDCFGIEGARKLVQRLSKLDSSGFVARAYVSALMKDASRHVSFSVDQILNSGRCEEWVKQYQDLVENHKDLCGTELAVFINRVTSHMQTLSIEAPTDEKQVTKLLVDALCATDMRVDWLYVYEGEVSPVKNYSSQLCLFPSMDVLEREVIAGDLPFGVHICGVASTGLHGREEVSNMVVCKTPTRAFVLSNMTYAFSQNAMRSAGEQRMTSDFWTEPTTHFPKWDKSTQLPALQDSYTYAFSDMAAMSGSDVLWAYMTMELAARICLSQVPTHCSASLRLLDLASTGSATAGLPALWTKPFEVATPSIAALLKEHEQHPNYKWMASLFEGLSDEVLLPDESELGFDVRARKAIPETYDHEAEKLINRYGNPSTNTYSTNQRYTVNLYPRPTAVFGDEAEVNAQVSKVAQENFDKLLRALMAADWTDKQPEITKWFDKALRRRFDKVLAFRKQYKDVCFIVPREGYRSNHRVQTSNSPYLKYHPVAKADGFDVTEQHVPIRAPRIGHLDVTTGKRKGFKSKAAAKNEYYINPMSAEDLMLIFDYKKSQLPEPLRHWHKTELGGWGHHDLTAWLVE